MNQTHPIPNSPDPASTTDTDTVEPRPLEDLGESIALQSAHIDAAHYQLLCDLREFDQRYGWDGFRSCAHWFSWRTGIDEVTARQKVRVAHALAELPLVSEEFRRGALSYSKVRAIARVGTPQNEADLVAMAKDGTASQLERVVRGLRRLRTLEQARVEPRAQRYLDTRVDEDGMLVVRGRLPAEVGALLVEALAAMEAEVTQSAGSDSAESEAPADQLVEPETVQSAAAQRRADALGRMAQRVLAGGSGQPRAGDGYQVVVHVEQAALLQPDGKTAELDDGEVIAARTAQRLSCDAPTVEVVEHNGEVVAAGRKRRRPTTAQYRALKARDRSCCFPGCERRHGLSAHHVQHWAAGGATDMRNTGLLCALHHWAVHEGGFCMEGQAPDGLRFFFPDGRPLSAVPAAPPVPDDPAAALAARHAATLPPITPQTNQCTWDGRRWDYDWAVDLLFERDFEHGELPCCGSCGTDSR